MSLEEGRKPEQLAENPTHTHMRSTQKDPSVSGRVPARDLLPVRCQCHPFISMRRHCCTYTSGGVIRSGLRMSLIHMQPFIVFLFRSRWVGGIESPRANPSMHQAEGRDQTLRPINHWASVPPLKTLCDIEVS